MTKDLMLGLAGLAIATGYYVLAAAIPSSLLADTVGPGGLPAMYAYVLGALSVVLIAKSLKSRITNRRMESPIADPRSPMWRAAGLLAIGIVYLAVIPWLGYLPSLALLMLAASVYQGAAPRPAVLVSLSGAVVFWALFVRLLQIPHPPGVWASLF